MVCKGKVFDVLLALIIENGVLYNILLSLATAAVAKRIKKKKNLKIII